MPAVANPHKRETISAAQRRAEELSQQLHDTDRARLHKELAVAHKDLVELEVVNARAKQDALKETVEAGDLYAAEQANVLKHQTAFVEAVERASALRDAYLKNWRRANRLGSAPLPQLIPTLSLRAQKERGDLLKLMRRLGAAVSTDV